MPLYSNSTTNYAPTVQKFLTTGTTTGWLFTISTSTTVAVGDTYTNNGNTYTVLGALTAQTGQVFFTSQAAAPLASGTLTKAVSASGPATITFSASIALATYTTPTSPRTPLYLKIKTVGGGGGGGSSGTASTNNGTAGLPTFFGANIALAGAGLGGGNAGGTGAAGGDPTLNTSGTILLVESVGGGGGGGVQGVSTSTQYPGGVGGNSMFGGGGFSVASGGSGSGKTNSGGGGAGGGTGGTASSFPGSGGGAGAGIEFVITSPASSYPYIVGTGGAGGGAGTSGNAGGNGAAGLVVVEEFYQ
jgi:hypothetical protein